MGHWEQIGRDNAEERARLAALPRWRRILASQGRAALIALAWAALVIWVVSTFRGLRS